MVEIKIEKGIIIPKALLPLPRDCGLELWSSKRIENWIRHTLRADLYTINIYKSNKICSLVLAFRELMPFLKLASGYPYSTILGNSDLFWENFGLVRKKLKSFGISRVELALTGDQSNHVLSSAAATYIEEKYFKSLNAMRHIINLSVYEDSDAYFDSLSGKLRWSVRKGIKNGVSIESADMDSVAVAQGLYVETMRDIHAPPNYSIDRLKTIIEELAFKKLGNVYLAKCESSILSMAAVIDSETTRHLIQIATPKKHRSTRVSDYLIWYLLEEAINLGKTHFDFMASSKNDQTLMEYKQKWNCAEEEIIHAVITLSPIRSRLVDVARYLNRAMPLKTLRAEK